MGFEDILFLFNSSKKDRKFIRMNLKEAGALFDIAQKSPGDILEIGTMIGGSAILLAAAAPDNCKVYSVDIISCQERKAFTSLKNYVTSTLLNNIEFIIGKSVEVAQKWEKELGLVFIDGNHTVMSIAKDIDAWRSRVMTGGFLVFHDVGVPTSSSGRKLAQQLLRKVNSKLKKWYKVNHIESLLILQRP